MAKKSFVVHIAGQRYVVRSDADESYVQTLASYVDERIQEVSRSSKPVTSQSLAILAAMNIADELHQEVKRRNELRRQVSERSRAIMAFLDQEVLRVQEQMQRKKSPLHSS